MDLTINPDSEFIMPNNALNIISAFSCMAFADLSIKKNKISKDNPVTESNINLSM